MKIRYKNRNGEFEFIGVEQWAWLTLWKFPYSHDDYFSNSLHVAQAFGRLLHILDEKKILTTQEILRIVNGDEETVFIP